jgi:hypothetical protein
MHGTVRKAALARHNLSLENSDKSSENSDAMRLVRLAAEPRQVGDSVKTSITRVARVLKWSPTRARDVWYGSARRIGVAEMDSLRALERRKLEADFVAERRRNIEQVAVLRTRLQMRDQEFHRDDIAALDWMLREVMSPSVD